MTRTYIKSVNGANPDSEGNVNIAVVEGATSNTAGKAGLVPAPAAGKQNMALCGDATYKVLPISGGGTGADNATSALKALGIIGAFTGVNVDGQKLTFNKKDGSTVSVNTQDTNNGIVTALLNQNGYVKFANGLVLQWGYANNSTSGTTTINYHIPYSLVAMAYTTNHTSANSYAAVNINNCTLNSFDVHARAYNNGNLIFTNDSFNWFAIGK